jgi:RND family efflux transporter MFP subunit
VDEAKIINDMADMVEGLESARLAVNDTIFVLDNTVTNTVLTDSWLSAQKTAFTTLKNNVVSTLMSAENTLQGLQRLGLVDDQQKTQLVNAVRTAENQLDSAKNSYDNSLASLENTRFAAEQQIISAQTALDSARSQLNLARVQAADLTIGSPIAGTITEKTVELGTEVSPGLAIAQVAQTGLVKVLIDLTTEDARAVEVGMNAELAQDGNVLSATITKIYPTADTASKKIRVEIAYQNEGRELIPGTFVDVAIPAKPTAGGDFLYIPLEAVTIGASNSYVFLADNGQAKRVIVEVGRVENDQIQILSGLSTGDILIVEGAKSLEDGDKIEITA